VKCFNVAKAVAFAALSIASFSSSVMPVAAQSLKLRATMETVCQVQISDLARSLDLGKGETAITVGTVNEQCNKAGFIVAISSANRGALVNAQGSRIPYQVQYDGSGLLTLNGQRLWLRLSASVGQNNKDLSVTVPARPQATAGDYSDTITVTIAAL
jgi:spore coat protein U-like protein